MVLKVFVCCDFNAKEQRIEIDQASFHLHKSMANHLKIILYKYSYFSSFVGLCQELALDVKL